MEWINVDKIIQKNKAKKKPCKSCGYCPYGGIVELFPLLGSNRKDAIEHNLFLVKQLKKGAYKDAKKICFENEVKNFNPEKYPISFSKEEMERSCKTFGHDCPMFYNAEDIVEREIKN